MHKGTLKKLALLLTFWVALHLPSLKAQIFTAPLQASTTGTNPVDFEFRADGTMIGIGNLGVGSLLSGDQGDGTRLLWLPSLAAFRAGGIDTGGTVPLGSGAWDTSQIGAYSTAFGINAQASGEYSFAFGNNNQATGVGSTASGFFNVASGDYSTAMGGSTLASGVDAVAMGQITYATGPNSFARGFQSTASGYASSAMGYYTTAAGLGSSASGYYSMAVGDSSTAWGSHSDAYGLASTAAGLGLSASAAYSFVIGAYNVGGGDIWNWVATDPLFEVGNGTSSTPADALVVYKNGNAVLQGSLQVAPTGDIPMYAGH